MTRRCRRLDRLLARGHELDRQHSALMSEIERNERARKHVAQAVADLHQEAADAWATKFEHSGDSLERIIALQLRSIGDDPTERNP